MKLLNYTVEASLRSRQPITHFKIHRYSSTRHLVWWMLSVQWSPTLHCEFCDVETGLYDICEPCHEHNYCECGQRLEDAYGTPGDGFCARCR